MTPDKPRRRTGLNQIEPVMADVLQKVDRLIEGQGQLVELSVNTKADLLEVKISAENTARAVANLTVSSQKQFGQVNDRFDQVSGQFDQVNIRFDHVEANQHGMSQDINGLRQDIAELKAGQNLILQILREKLP